MIDLLRTCNAVSLCWGSELSIFLTRSLAPIEIDGHGLLWKLTCPCKIALKIPHSDSAITLSFVPINSHFFPHHFVFCSKNKTGEKDTSPKWGSSTKKNKQHHSNTPYINFWPIFSLQDFGCDVVCTADDVLEHFSCSGN